MDNVIKEMMKRAVYAREYGDFEVYHKLMSMIISSNTRVVRLFLNEELAALRDINNLENISNNGLWVLADLMRKIR